MIQIDGSQGEGGGQILRTALTFSILTGQPVQISRIRARRRNPGLSPQHLAGVLAAGQICGAEIQGAALRSTDIHFTPAQPAQAGDYTFDISHLSGQGSAGAVTLLLQAIWLPLVLADGESRLVVRGGTHVNWSPPVHYLQWVLFPTLARAGVSVEIQLDSWGWYPKGGGQVMVSIQGNSRLQGLDLHTRGSLTGIKGVGVACNLPAHIAQRISDRANNRLREAGLPPGTQPQRVGGHSTGAGLFMAAEYENAAAGFSALGEKGKPSEKVADDALDDLLDHYDSDQALDPHLPDQLLPALAMAGGSSTLSTVEITQHTLTNALVIRQFVEREITISGKEGQPGTVRVE